MGVKKFAQSQVVAKGGRICRVSVEIPPKNKGGCPKGACVTEGAFEQLLIGILGLCAQTGIRIAIIRAGMPHFWAHANCGMHKPVAGPKNV